MLSIILFIFNFYFMIYELCYIEQIPQIFFYITYKYCSHSKSFKNYEELQNNNFFSSRSKVTKGFIKI